MAKRRFESWLAVAVLGVGAVLAGILGLWGFMSATARPIHPNPDEIRSEIVNAPDPAWTAAVERAERIMRAGIAEQNLPGVSVAVGIDGQIVWAEAFGWADTEARVPVTAETQFRIGTASKALTSAAAGLLLEQGRISLDNDIQTYVPDFPRKDRPVTLRQLMGHTAGIRPDEGDEENVWTRCDRTADGLKRFAQSRLLFEPGTQYRYSTYGWMLVSAAIEAAADEPFARLMRTQVFDPLGMTSTRTDAAADAPGNRSVYYFPRFAGDPRYGHQGPENVDYSCFSGGSAILSSGADLVRFVMALNKGTLLKPATVELLQTSQRLPSGQDTGYGLGWDLETVELAGKPTRWIGYDGEMRGGTVSSFATFPDHGNMAVAITSNISFADTTSLVLKIAEAFARR
jgi:CubicO group peptidase (beta-lactamase class C family)